MLTSKFKKLIRSWLPTINGRAAIITVPDDAVTPEIELSYHSIPPNIEPKVTKIKPVINSIDAILKSCRK